MSAAQGSDVRYVVSRCVFTVPVPRGTGTSGNAQCSVNRDKGQQAFRVGQGTVFCVDGARPTITMLRKEHIFGPNAVEAQRTVPSLDGKALFAAVIKARICQLRQAPPPVPTRPPKTTRSSDAPSAAA